MDKKEIGAKMKKSKSAKKKCHKCLYARKRFGRWICFRVDGSPVRTGRRSTCSHWKPSEVEAPKVQGF